MLRNLFSPLFFVLCSLCLGVSQPVVAAKAEPVAAAATAPASDRLNINSADAAAFQHGMVGIGEAKAKAIVQYREENGPFSSVDDLLEVKGIGVKTLEKNRDKLSIE